MGRGLVVNVKVNKLYGMDSIFGIKKGAEYEVVKEEGYWFIVKMSNNTTACVYKGQIINC